jgi:hypothetical protein
MGRKVINKNEILIPAPKPIKKEKRKRYTILFFLKFSKYLIKK